MSKIKVGIIGCGEVAQVIHIPNFNNLNDKFELTYICDISQHALDFCSAKAPRATTTTDPEQLISSDTVELVFITASDEFHCDLATMALNYNKNVFIEKPLTLTLRDADRIIEAGKQATSARAYVGYMRRHAAAFVDALKLVDDKILYARVRDIIGPNSTFVSQSGMYPKKFPPPQSSSTSGSGNIDRGDEMTTYALEHELGVPATEQNKSHWRLLCGLGSHDLSAMREALGVPNSVLAAKQALPFWTALFDYGDFAVTYESGIDNIPRFDAHIEIYTEKKSIRVQYDTPYVKGLPVKIHICENVNGEYQESMIRRTYEDPYTLQLLDLYDCFAGSGKIKTTVEDAREDLVTFGKIMKAQAQTSATPA